MGARFLVGAGDSLHGAISSATGRARRRCHLAALVALTFALLGSTRDTCAEGTWSIIGRLETRRFNHPATLVTDGRILVAGGERDIGVTVAVEIFDPTTDARRDMRTSPLAAASAVGPSSRGMPSIVSRRRWRHTANG